MSGSPPTDTRPQARAKLGNPVNTRFGSVDKGFFAPAAHFFTAPPAQAAQPRSSRLRERRKPATQRRERDDEPYSDALGAGDPGVPKNAQFVCDAPRRPPAGEPLFLSEAE
ncbi:hypothetical protein Ms3S1_13330 [Methylosinus sp. 3S-1]